MNGGGDAAGIADYLATIWRRAGMVLACALVCALAAFLVALPQTPVYQARVAMEIQSINDNFLNTRDVNPLAGPSDYSTESYLQTQLKILQEDALLERVALKMELHKKAEFAPKPKRLDFVRNLILPRASRVPSALDSAVSEMSSNLKVRPVGQTRIVEVLFDWTDSQFAADLANTLADEFIDQSMEGRWKATQRTANWLRRELTELKAKLEDSQNRLIAYARDAGLLFTSEKGTVAEDKLRQLQDELSRAQAERVARQSRYETALSSAADTLPEVLDNEPLRAARVQMNDLRRQLSELSVQFTPQFYKVKNVEAQIAELDAIIKRERGTVLDRIRNEYESALRREKLIAGAFTDQALLVSHQAAKAVQYDMLKHEAESNRGLYEAMLRNVNEAGIASAVQPSNVRIIRPAKPPLLPYKPDYLLNTALGFGAGLLIGVIFVLGRERKGASICAPGDAAQLLNVPELGVIPSAAGANDRAVYGRLGSIAGLEGQPARNKIAGSVELATWERKPSVLAESFRATLASIVFSSEENRRSTVFVLTSPDRGTGKTTVVTNLGIALAEINRRVLLVDGDLRRPRLHSIFNLSNDRGLAQFLREDRPVEDYPSSALIQPTQIPGVYVLPSGKGDGDITSLLYSSRMTELLWRFRLEFHTVLVDTPPMLHLPDARILGRIADGVILVLKAGVTTREEALAVRQRLFDDRTPIAGTVLNQWEPGQGHGSYYSCGYQGPGQLQTGGDAGRPWETRS